MAIELKSIITCPECGHMKEEEMPTDACRYFYECENCKTVLKPINNDCCVYCSYGTVPCPSIQENSCCAGDWNGIRVNVVSLGMVEDGYEKYKDYFPGHKPIPMRKVVSAYLRSVKGKDNGNIIRNYE